MRAKYERRLFHWSYIFEAPFLLIVFLPIWVTAKINHGSKAKGLIDALKTCLNKHECEFSDEVFTDEGFPYRKCKNKHCNTVTTLDKDGKWLSDWLYKNE